MLEAREHLVSIGKQLHQLGFLAAADGNLSFKISDDCFLITPRGIPKRLLKSEQILLIDNKGERIEGSGDVSSEVAMHLGVYRHSPHAKAVIHAHPKSALAWTLVHPSDKELPAQCMAEIILATGGIPIVPYARTGTLQMSEALHPYLPHFRALILARHGALTWGEDFEEALSGMERLEHVADTLLRARSVGPLSFLPPEEIEVLFQMRKKMGERLC